MSSATTWHAFKCERCKSVKYAEDPEWIDDYLACLKSSCVSDHPKRQPAKMHRRADMDFVPCSWGWRPGEEQHE